MTLNVENLDLARALAAPQLGQKPHEVTSPA